MTGSATSALYAISTLCLLCALIVMFALPQQLRSNDRRPDKAAW